MKRKDKKKLGIARSVLIGVIIVIIVIAAVAVYFLMPKHVAQQITTTTQSTSTTSTTTPSQVVAQAVEVAPTSFLVIQGTPITFSFFNVQQGATLRVYFGDGNIINTTSSNITYNYKYGGHYLVLVEEYVGNKLVSSNANSLLPITVQPSIPNNLAGLVTIPTISFNVTRNPSAPIVNVNETLYLYGGYLELPTGQNMTIYEYVWNFGNGKTLTVMANESNDYLPEVNPVNVSYSSPGLYPVMLTIVTKNVSSGALYNFSVIYTIAVSSPSMTFLMYKWSGNVPNPGTITVVENVPGGPYSFDPDIDYESVGFEVISNIFATLLIYNGSSTTSFIPFVAEYIPTVQNGGISDNYTVYTFKIRPGLYFSNGDPITAYDVWYSMIRALLFVGGTPGTGDWILAQYLIPNSTIGVPIVNQQNENEAFNLIMHAVTYNNQTDTVTFHLVKPTPPQLFFTALADPLDSAILDAKWLEQVGAGINFTPAGFLQYEQYGNEGDYNTQVQWNPVTSGPYMIKEYVPGQYVVLVPNPYFPGIPGIPKPNDTVVIEWVKDPETAYDLFISGQADIVTALPTNYIAALKPYVAQGQVLMYEFPTLSEFFFVFNLNISVSLLKKINPSYNIPSDYFANLYVRKAFAYAFNYTNYIDNLLGNVKYGIDFGSPYAGVIIPGLPYYTPPPPSLVPTFNLTYAKELMIKSGMYNVSVSFPIIVTAGDTVDYAAAEMWAQALHEIDPNINAQPMYLPFSQIIAYMVPGENPMPIYQLGWIADYPYPSDFVNAMYLENGTYPAPDGWYVSYLQQLGYTQEAKMYQELNQLILEADSATNPTIAQQLYANVTALALQLYMYVYTYQANAFWIIKPYMHGYNNNIAYEENPMIGGAGDSLYYWWVKG